ncbi:LCP family protein [Georgenia sp. SYP-B2076]|uniref:LCP family protein n=1 Tax=Georgenia sp. SYP-B2076 TaxID=2495881 RepID=UPI00197ABEA5|nr:LCP family protein [Georgenia sp. SYP-B2076]
MALLAALVGAAAVLQAVISGGMERINDPFADLAERPANHVALAPPGGDAAAPAAPVTILLLGSDSRISAGDPARWEAGAQRTDAIMLVQVAGNRRSAAVMSIPRDSWVDVPGHGENKINAAYSFGGPTLMIQTVEQLTGIRIDHFAIADFESFATLTDELGGVEIPLPEGMSSGGVDLAPGMHTLDGAQALAYARQRYGLPGGDFDRVQHQQTWMRSMMKAAYRREVLTDPVALMRLLQTVSKGVAVDEGFTIGAMRDLAISMRDVRPGDLAFLTAPYMGTGRSPDGTQSIVLLDAPAFAELCQAFAADDVAGYLAAHPGAVKTLGGDAASGG